MVFLTMFNQVAVLFLLMAVGYVLAKTGMIDENGSSQLTSLLCYIIIPAINIYVFQMKFSAGMFGNFLIVAAATAGIQLFNILAGMILFNKKTVRDPEKRRMTQFAAAYSNCGFMGFPLLQTLAGTNGLFYGSAFNGVFSLFAWSHGMMLYSGKVNKKSILKAAASPTIISVIVGALLFRFSISLPGPIYSTVKYISQLNTPLSMIVIGTTITQIPLRSIFTDRLVWIGAVTRNMLFPFAIMFLLHAVGLHGLLLLCCIIPAACPAAGLTVIFAKLTGKDVVFPGKLMTLSTVISLITMPLIITAISALKF